MLRSFTSIELKKLIEKLENSTNAARTAAQTKIRQALFDVKKQKEQYNKLI